MKSKSKKLIVKNRGFNTANHSILPPSSAARRVQCRGSRELEGLYPSLDSSAAREGCAAHWVALQALTGKIVTTGDKTPDGEITTTPEMIEGAALYVDYVKSITQHLDKDCVDFEAPLVAPSVHPQAWGTCDCFAYDEENKCLHIIDYKFGHSFVPVFKNWQLIYYAIAAIDTRGFPAETIVCHIVQPRYYGIENKIRSCELTRLQLNEYANFLKIVEIEALEDNAALKTGSECAFCSARHVCTELQETTAFIADFIQAENVHDLSPQSLGYELKTLLNAQELLKARIMGLSQEAESRLTEGKRVPGFMLQPGRSNQVWDKPAQEVIEMGKLLGVDLAKPQEVITPKQAIKANIPEGVVNQYSTVIPGGFKLAEDKKRI